MCKVIERTVEMALQSFPDSSRKLSIKMYLQVCTLRGGGHLHESVQGGGRGQKSMTIERGYFLNGPYHTRP